MALPSFLNAEAPIFVPARLVVPADQTTTSVLLDYFANLRETSTSTEAGGRSAPAPNGYHPNNRAARAAMDEFAWYYGEDPSDLFAWQGLIWVCAFEMIPDTVEECRAVRNHLPSQSFDSSEPVPSAENADSKLNLSQLFHTIHVNIFDLVEVTRWGLKAKSFLHAGDLAVYSKATGRIFPVSVAKEGTLCKAFLRKFE